MAPILVLALQLGGMVFGGVFVEIGRERDAGGLKDAADLSGNGGA